MKPLRLLVLITLCSSLGCSRELLPLDPSLIIEGYEIRGTVSDRFGHPIPGVDVTVDYTLEWVNDGPEPSRVYQVPSQGESITVTVVSRDGRTIFLEALGLQEEGPFSFIWDGRSSSGQFAAPGLYEVRYLAGSGTRLAYSMLVSGTRATSTDSLGRFTIRDWELPIGFYPVPEYSPSGSTYYGNLRVTSELVLGFSIEGFSTYRNVTLRRNEALIFDTWLD